MIETISNPSAPLTTFTLGQQDGYFFEYMLTGSLNKLELFSTTNLWSMVLEGFQNEPCVRHIMLGSAMIHRSRSDPNMSRNKEAQRLASRHYSNAVRLLSNLLSPARGNPGGEAGSSSHNISSGRIRAFKAEGRSCNLVDAERVEVA
jgi:hypothetical protein